MGNCLKTSESTRLHDTGEHSRISNSTSKSKPLDKKAESVNLSSLEFSLKEYDTKDFFRKGASSSLSIVLNTKTSRLYIIRELDISEFGEDYKKLIINEIKQHSVCNHPNILGFFGFHRDNNKLSILLEHMETNVAKVFNGKFFSGESIHESLIIRIYKNVLIGLDYLFKEFGSPHRDLRPQHILMNKDHSKIKISGFGSFKLLERADVIKIIDSSNV